MFHINQKLPFLALMLLLAASGNPCAAQESGFLGIGFEPLGSDRADNAGLERDDFPFVLEVADNSPAAAAGLRRGDVLLALNGQTLTAPQMPHRVSQLQPGALRFEPNDLIDDRTWRIGAHFHSFYAAFHGRMDAERTRVDIGFRGSM